MDSSVVLSAPGASNGYSTPSSSELFRPTSSTFAVEADVHASAQPCSDDVSSPATSSPGISQSPAVVSLRHQTANSGNMATTEGGRARFVSDRQRLAWDEMHDRMERRRREWNAQVDRMRNDFFKLKPPTSSANDAGQSSAIIASDQVDDVEPSWPPSTITRQQFQVINILLRCSFSFIVPSAYTGGSLLTPSTPAVPNCCCSKGAILV